MLKTQLPNDELPKEESITGKLIFVFAVLIFSLSLYILFSSKLDLMDIEKDFSTDTQSSSVVSGNGPTDAGKQPN